MGDRIKCCSFLDLSPLNGTQKCLLKIKFGMKYVNSIIKFVALYYSVIRNHSLEESILYPFGFTYAQQ